MTIIKEFIEDILENYLLSEEIEPEKVEKSLSSVKKILKDKYDYESQITKSNLGGGYPTYFLKVFGPKETWKNNISLNSPLHIMFRVENGNTIDVTNHSYQIRNAKIKFRKTRAKTEKDIENKILEFFEKNNSGFTEILSEVSKKTLGSYIKGASNSLVDIQRDIGDTKFRSKNYKELSNKRINRRLGIARAVDKLTKEDLDESTEYKILHKDFTSAAQTAFSIAEKQGFKIDEDEWFRKVSSGPRKPSNGKTNSYHIELMKTDDKPTKKMLHFQVYNTGNSYELNAYIN